MLLALKEAKKGYKKDEVPVGAVIVKDGKIISKAHSLVNTEKDPTAHAEILAIRKAVKKLKYERLNGCTIYSTVEPCAMCAGALVLARVEGLVFGCLEEKTGGVKSVFKITGNKQLNHKIKVTCGVLAEECGKLMKDFFKEKRRKR
jgi:tRNA(adenine34) deaminase